MVSLAGSNQGCCGNRSCGQSLIPQRLSLSIICRGNCCSFLRLLGRSLSFLRLLSSLFPGHCFLLCSGFLGCLRSCSLGLGGCTGCSFVSLTLLFSCGSCFRFSPLTLSLCTLEFLKLRTLSLKVLHIGTSSSEVALSFLSLGNEVGSAGGQRTELFGILSDGCLSETFLLNSFSLTLLRNDTGLT